MSLFSNLINKELGFATSEYIAKNNIVDLVDNIVVETRDLKRGNPDVVNLFTIKRDTHAKTLHESSMGRNNAPYKYIHDKKHFKPHMTADEIIIERIVKATNESQKLQREIASRFSNNNLPNMVPIQSNMFNNATIRGDNSATNDLAMKFKQDKKIIEIKSTILSTQNDNILNMIKVSTRKQKKV